MQRLIGLLVVLGTVLGGFAFAGGNLATMWQPAEFLIIFGAGIGALIVGNSKFVLLEMLSQLKYQLFSNKNSHTTDLYHDILMVMYSLLDLVQSKGIKALDDHVENSETSSIFLAYPKVAEFPQLVTFICDNFRLYSMGKINSHDFDAILEQEIYTIEEQKLKPSHALGDIAEAMPGFGILAAVGGIIITMQHLDGPMSEIGYHVAAALVGTFIGIFACYCLMAPLSTAMASYVKKQMALLECVRAMLVAHAKGHVAIVAIDSGRKLINEEIKPSFTTMEQWINNRAA
ncbi:flagellar motor stator protein MotA [Colwellia sp. 4_MG-2023]|jgi:chemotaxis protein MotA|uniref:flagellar motor stator protein MotA n=1 Tax=unclassified Colwellia TaxID=196834 RepID=UPI001C0A44D6|nr:MULTISPECIES: flagellar motor stator protein MotA [unclassified Colwellia]MBU2926105.1 flagellar motor stator protein MotA [Colwellia sp. C2M11]MDO6487397.1 flagellar motor stator protein MotA [Colwellia sp. 6_MG-2023]MDO6508303.1 flagellar motor stator protein MotA [Colwellia sp. 5_MG-2023]MDO6556954.1 flagellar motor stator protein MotA [Colwellia sp. 4_MG-2023]MDO6652474.1 flagellar motor stator protein MotA [Colwellia sp. 3_MG-2023]